MNYQYPCPHCEAVTVIAENADFDGACTSCGRSVFQSPDEGPNEKAPATASTVNEGNELGNGSTPQHTSLQQAIANTLFEFILDQKFGDRENLLSAEALTISDVEEICSRFNLPLAEVIENVKVQVAP